MTLSESRQVVAPNKGSRLRLTTSLELASCANPLTPLSLGSFKRCPARDSGSVEMALPLCASDLYSVLLSSKYCQVIMEAFAELHVKRDPRLRQFFIRTLWLFRHLFVCYVVHTHKCTA